ncbi:MAG: hypothetical protein KF894_27675 [Labilithrix sp.]|nr:hypothetical protein [Labilithrix sp.]
MAENARPPVAVRIVRPYETEEAFLENELETVGKTSVILIGAHSRPTGVILRFEVTLASGATVLRGEGRVLAHKESAFRGQPGLALRFTRLDPKSKALVDRAAAIREARLAGDTGRGAAPEATSPAALPPVQPSAPALPVPDPSAPAETSAPPPEASAPAAETSAPPPAPDAPPPSARPAPQHAASLPPDPVLAQILTAPTPPPPAADGRGRRGDRRRSTGPDRRSERPTGAPAPDTSPPAALSPLVEGEPAASAHATAAPTATDGASPEAAATVAPTMTAEARASGPQAVTSLPSALLDPAMRSLPPPPDRDALLARLRARAANLTDEQKAAILRSS